MKVLVTGHKGYIGTVLVPLLLDREVVVVPPVAVRAREVGLRHLGMDRVHRPRDQLLLGPVVLAPPRQHLPLRRLAVAPRLQSVVVPVPVVPLAAQEDRAEQAERQKRRGDEGAPHRA